MQSKIVIIAMAIAFFLPFQAISQKDITVSWGPELKYDRRAPYTDILGDDGEFFYVLKSEKRGRKVEKYSLKNLSQVWSKDFELPKIDKYHFGLLGIYQTGDQFIVFSSNYEKDSRTSTIYAQILSNDGVLSSQYKKIQEVVYDEKKQTSIYQFKVSRDGQKFLLYQNLDLDKMSNEKFAFKVYNKELNLLWEKSFELPYRDQVSQLKDVRISNDGNIFLVLEKDPDRKKGEKRERKIQNRKYNIMAFYPETDELRQYEIDLGIKYWISEMEYTINTDGDLMVTGFYSEENASSMDGFFFLKIDKDSKEVVIESMKEFDRDFKSNFMKEKHLDKDNEVGVFDMDATILREDGGILQVAEYYRFYVTTTTDSRGNTRTIYHYVYNEIMVMNISPEGKVEWISVVPKKQHTANDNGYSSSYAMLVNEDKIHFVFNDNPKNVVQYEKDPLKLKDMRNPKKALTMMSTIDEDGNLRRAPMFSAKDVKTILIPKFHYRLDNAKLLIFGLKGKKCKFGIVDFSGY